MDKFARNIKIVSFIIVCMFISLVVYLTNFMIKDAKTIKNNTYNQRNYIQEEKVKRGDILDRNGKVLATTIKVNGRNTRYYPYGRLFSHVIGYSSRRYGKNGIELLYNNELLGYENGVMDKISSKIMNKEDKGENVKITLDYDLQKIAADELQGKTGSIVALNPKTGEVLAMVSKPDFDPNSIDEQWKTLRDSATSPFYNRATQGLYPPGSTFKTITALAAYKYVPDIDNFSYTCTGSRNINGYTLRCFGGESHGYEKIDKAFEQSCNTAFAGIGMLVGRNHLIRTARAFGFNQTLPFELPLSNSSISIDSDSQADLAQASIGQGKVLATPLQMALVASAVANNGVMMKPHITKGVYSDKLNIATKEEDIETLRTSLSSAECDKIKTLMENVVNNGTGTAAQIYGVKVAGKTGTAEASDKVTHAWFIGFAPADNPKIAVAVLIENTQLSGGTVAAPIAKDIMQKAIEINE